MTFGLPQPTTTYYKMEILSKYYVKGLVVCQAVFKTGKLPLLQKE